IAATGVRWRRHRTDLLRPPPWAAPPSSSCSSRPPSPSCTPAPPPYASPPSPPPPASPAAAASSPPPPPPFPGSRVVARPWPEWTRLVEHLAAGGYADRLGAVSSVAIGGSVGGGDDDSFFDREGLTEEFIKTAGTCLSFARDRPELLRMLSKKDIEVIVENGSPLVFRNGDNSIRRMRSFLNGSESNVLESETAKTVDIIRYLLSYIFNPDGTVDASNSKAKELTEASVRNLFAELVSVSGTVRATSILESTRQPPLQQHEQLSRPPGQNIEMKRGDWICPTCSFMNFARNMRCLECNEVRPKRVLTGGEWECPQCDFFNYGRNMSCLRCDCKRPGELPVNPLAPSGSTVFNRTSSVEQILNGSNVQFRNNSGIGGPSSGTQFGRFSGAGSDKSSISETLDRILGRPSASSGSNNENVNSSENRENLVNQRRDPNHVPFVPLPPDMFATTQNTNPNTQSAENTIANRSEKEDSDAAERWSKKVAELDNTADLSSAISDEDFPEIMPMRKGENRFVISKKKDRSLTSPQYKRRIALEQANNSNFVPFVPFPPDYFAKKDKSSEANASPTVGSTEGSRPPETNGTNLSQNNLNEKKASSAYGTANDSSQEPNTSGYSRSNNSWNSGYSTNNTFGSSSGGGVSTQQPESASNSKESWNRGFPGKSLEGSAVKDPDPLDMSEEAKAERWFRRAAQIKDISELANIPDEDFPEIMPMRKGVNRFVVSKRKTPLERRLTSPQYRRNLPIVSSEPEKDSN
ncbi:zinc finger protein VAR3, chloroplastic, partial [Ananas comosus]|uniref:Zinc finger protein VAR3, chloroplastic n=1 Tax=Ananas comosus TaxID=4615 RepID=A0A6P5HIB5_ANACO